jgi:cytoskeletal protein CcmA (bactofilin family)
VALVLGENSSVEGNVAADDVVIRGRLIGSVKALRVTLQSNSHVQGDLTHQSLAIEQGALFRWQVAPFEESSFHKPNHSRGFDLK